MANHWAWLIIELLVIAGLVASVLLVVLAWVEADPDIGRNPGGKE